MRRIGGKGLALIQAYEQFRSLPYRDAVGIWTYGFGAIRDAGGLPVTAATPPLGMDEGARLLARDCAQAAGAVQRLIFVPLDPDPFDALCSFAFNLGGGALQRSTLRQVLNRGEAPDEDLFARWDMAGGRHLAGLRRRRLAEWELFAGHAAG